MKGAVFIALNDMIESQFGLDTWEAVLAKAQPESEGVYTSGSSYSDEEITTLIAAASEQLGAEVNDVLRQFGEYLFGELNSKFPIFFVIHNSLLDFLGSIESVIHKEVEKLYHDACLPSIKCKKMSESHMQMHYSSPRKLCFLAEGLIIGAARHFKTEIELSQSRCSHRGDSLCVIDIKIL